MLEVVPFTEDHLDGAAELLAERHARQREAEPLLPRQFEGSSAARGEVEAAWRKDGASGVVALEGERLAGYLIAAPRDDTIWGQNVWVELAGHAATEAEVIRDLYAVAAEDWVEQGRPRHYALVPAADSPLVEAWFRLSFGQQHAQGIREVPVAADAGSAGGLRVRTAGKSDLDALVELDALLPEHQERSPVFSRAPRPSADELRVDWGEDLGGPGEGIFIAELDGRPVGCASVAPVERSSMHTGLSRPERACILGFAVTRPDVRGSGAGLALTDAVFAWAREHGYPTIVTDWRVTNLLSSRFWPRRGWRETFLRLYRSIP